MVVIVKKPTYNNSLQATQAKTFVLLASHECALEAGRYMLDNQCYALVFLVSVFGLLVASPSSANTPFEECAAHLQADGGYKTAHENEGCLRAANEGSASAQYSVGMGFGFSGRHDLEEKYYRLAASQGAAPAYLGLGHVLREKKPAEAIRWYEKFVHSRYQGYGYAAKQLELLYLEIGDRGKAAHWHDVCRESGYEGCN